MLPNLKILDGKQISTELVRKRKAWAARWAAQHGKKDAGGEKGEEEEAPHAEDGKGKRPEARPAPKKAGEAQEKPAPKAAGKRTREESEKEGLKGRTQKKTRTEPQNEKPEPAAQAKVAEQPSKKRSARDEKVDASKPAEPQAKKGRSETEKNNKTTNEPKKREAPTARANAASAATATATATTKKKPANKFDERSREMRATAGKKSAPKKEPEMEPVEEEKGEIERKLEEHVQLVTGNSGLLEVIKASDTPKSGGQQQPANKKGKGKAAAVGQTATSASAKKVQSVLDLMGLTPEPEVGLGVGNAWA